MKTREVTRGLILEVRHSIDQTTESTLGLGVISPKVHKPSVAVVGGSRKRKKRKNNSGVHAQL